jgi:hypothetical protein
MGANYNFTIEGDSLVMRRTPISGDTEPKTITFKSPSLVNALGKIRLFEAGEFQTSLIFTEFGIIGGLIPTGIENAEELLLLLFGTINGGISGDYIPLSGTTAGNPITGELDYGSDLSATFTDRSLVDKGYVDSKNSVVHDFIDGTSEYHTGTTVETELYKFLIPANTYGTLDTIDFEMIITKNGASTGSDNVITRISTTGVFSTLSSANRIAGVLVGGNSASVYLRFTRKFILKDTKIFGIYNLGSYSNDYSTVIRSETTFDTTVNNYIHISSQLGNPANQVQLTHVISKL